MAVKKVLTQMSRFCSKCREIRIDCMCNAPKISKREMNRRLPKWSASAVRELDEAVALGMTVARYRFFKRFGF